MAISVACPSCKSSLKVGDHLAGKKVKCPRCSEAVPIGQPKSASATVDQGRSPASAPPAPKAAANGSTEAPISVACAGCKKKLQVKAALAGKAIKCPGCGQPVRIPAAATTTPVTAPTPPPPAPAAEEDEWADVNEAAAPPPAASSGGGAAASESGQELLEPLELPDDMREKISAALTKNERILWADRPQMDMLIHQAHQFRKIGMILGIAGIIGLPALGVVFLFVAKSWIPLIPFCLFGLLFAAVGVYARGAPARQHRNGPKRACYLLTNRRVLIHPGAAMGGFVVGNRTDTSMALASARGQLTSFTGLELGHMSRSESAKFEGCGILCFHRDLLDRPFGVGFSSLKDVREVERKIRQHLVDPLIDKMLRGEKLTKDEKGDKAEDAKKAGEETDVIPPDANIKEFVRGGKPVPAASEDEGDDPNVKSRTASDEDDEDDPNTKTRTSSVEGSVEAASDEHREAVEAELTEGEEALWIGEPQGKTKGRGILGAVTGAAHRYEPDYYLYAITNRRVLLFCQKGSKDSQSAVFGGSKDTQGPVTYYPPHLLAATLEQDNRIPNGGNILFRKVKRIIQTQSTSTGSRRGHGSHRGTMYRTKSTTTSTRIEIHHFGILRVRNYLPVARLLYDKLLAPLADK